MEGSKVEVGKEAELSGVIEVNEEQIRSRLHEVVRGTVEETLIEMYIAGVSVRRVDDITEALWGTRVSASTVSELNKKLYIRLEEWLARFRYLQNAKWHSRCHLALKRFANAAAEERNGLTFSPSKPPQHPSTITLWDHTSNALIATNSAFSQSVSYQNLLILLSNGY